MNSPATSPPSSIPDGGSDDDFTTALLKGVAKKLGVEYETKFFGERHDATKESVFFDAGEILRQIDVRSKALGPDHPSVSSLHLKAAELLQDEQKIEDHLIMALTSTRNRLEGRASHEVVSILSKLGALNCTRGNHLKAQEIFKQASDMCALLELGKVKQRSTVSLDDAHLRLVLSKVSQRDDIARTVASSVLLKAPERKTIETQTEADIVPIPNSLILSRDQLSRLKSPALRSVDDLKKLVQYVSLPEGLSSATAAKHTAATASSPKVARGKSSMQNLLETLEKVRRPPQADFQSATQREVARMLLEQYSTE